MLRRGSPLNSAQLTGTLERAIGESTITVIPARTSSAFMLADGVRLPRTTCTPGPRDLFERRRVIGATAGDGALCNCPTRYPAPAEVDVMPGVSLV
jgi:hypothetical protein